jgi:hypothetical protein
MPTRVSVPGLALLAALGVVLALLPARAQQIHRHSFASRQPALARGDANVRVEEKEHDISTQSFKSQPSSEHIKLVCDAGTGDAAFVHYFYETPPAPVSEVLSASVWVKATKPGVQLRARVVFPKEPDPERPEVPLTMLIVGDTYDGARTWKKLSLGNVPDLVGRHLPATQAKIGRAVNRTDAYIDRLVLNLYAGPGPLDVWVDDLDIGPVLPEAQPGAKEPGTPGVPARQKADPAAVPARARQVEHRDRQILVDGKPYFFRAIRHTGAPLHVLRAAGFEALWVPADVPEALLAEAAREGWMLIPSAPLLADDTAAVASRPGPAAGADRLAGFLRRFGDREVLFWDLGGGRKTEHADAVGLTAEAIRRVDPRRPRGADLWDGFQAYSQFLDVVGAHRWPLFTSLELPRYRDWLRQRKALTAGRSTYWTWVQDHLPDWYAAAVADGPGGNPDDGFSEPVGPHPEQIRLLAYIAVACGCRGLGFWSDKYLADSHHGRDRLQQLAILNTELHMLSPVVTAAQTAVWLDTSHPHVKAAALKGPRGLLLLPIWMGPGCQYVPDQGAVLNLKVTIPLVPDGAEPWLVTPAGVECLRHRCIRVPTGVELTIPEFDLVAPVVFTDDLSVNGLVVWWQDEARKRGRLAAKWALDLAAAEYEKVRAVHLKLSGAAGGEIRDPDALLQEVHRYYREAQKHYANELYDKAYQDALRALRPLRVLMRDHWRQAAGSLDVPTASPYAVSFFSLPKHWELFREVQASRPAASVLPGGSFELDTEVPAAGLRVDANPGWSARYGSLDPVAVAAGLVRTDGLTDNREPRKAPTQPRTIFAPSRPIAYPDEGYLPPAPELGKSCLKLEIRRQPAKDPDGKPLPVVPVLERTFLAVDSPPVRLPPGTLVRVSGWVKVPAPIEGTADGVLFYDNPGYDDRAARVPHAGGEPLAVRLLHTIEDGGERGVWKRFHLYRRVPATGQLGVTLALTGVGVAYFDDVRIEPLVSGGGRDAAYGPAAKGTPPRTGPAPPARWSQPNSMAPGVTPVSGWRR